MSEPTDFLSVDRLVDDDAVIVRARGEVDIFTVPLLAEQLLLATDTVRPPGPVVVDLTGVHFFASRGIAALVMAQQLCQELGVDFRVVAGRVVRRPLRAVGALELLNTCDSVTEALLPH